MNFYRTLRYYSSTYNLLYDTIFSLPEGDRNSKVDKKVQSVCLFYWLCWYILGVTHVCIFNMIIGLAIGRTKKEKQEDHRTIVCVHNMYVHMYMLTRRKTAASCVNPAFPPLLDFQPNNCLSNFGKNSPKNFYAVESTISQSLYSSNSTASLLTNNHDPSIRWCGIICIIKWSSFIAIESTQRLVSFDCSTTDTHQICLEAISIMRMKLLVCLNWKGMSRIKLDLLYEYKIPSIHQ